MSKPSCDACSNLREYNANFIMNGVTDDIAASLANNTGLNACLTDLHTDCEDLNDVNDCLIGHMDDDVDNYEVCDWKSLAHNFFPNLYETLKAMIASICGLWTKTATIEKSISELTTTVCNSLNEVGIVGINDSGISGGLVYSYLMVTKYTQPESCGGCTIYECWPEIHSMGGSSGEAEYDDSEKDIASRTPMAHLNKDDVVPSYLPESVWNSLCAGGAHSLVSCGSGLLDIATSGELATDDSTDYTFKTDKLYIWCDQGIAGAKSGDRLRSSMAYQKQRFTVCG